MRFNFEFFSEFFPDNFTKYCFLCTLLIETHCLPKGFETNYKRVIFHAIDENDSRLLLISYSLSLQCGQHTELNDLHINISFNII